MRNEIAEQCGCYALINFLVLMQQLCSVYLVRHYPAAGSRPELTKFVSASTLAFALLGVIGVIGAVTYNDSLVVLYAALLVVYSAGIALVCSYLARKGEPLSDYHCVLLVVSLLLASLTLTTLTTKHTYGDWMHSEYVIHYYVKEREA